MIRIRAATEPWMDSIQFLIFSANIDGSPGAVAKPIEFVPREDGTRIEPCLSLERVHAQALMDSLWDCGLRPTEGTGSAGAMAAQGKHLDDMRKLVFEHHVVKRE